MNKILGLVLGMLLSMSSYATNVAVIDFRAALLQSERGLAASVEPRKQVLNMENQLNGARKELDDLLKS